MAINPTLVCYRISRSFLKSSFSLGGEDKRLLFYQTWLKRKTQGRFAFLPDLVEADRHAAGEAAVTPPFIHCAFSFSQNAHKHTPCRDFYIWLKAIQQIRQIWLKSPKLTLPLTGNFITYRRAWYKLSQIINILCLALLLPNSTCQACLKYNVKKKRIVFKY